MTYLINENLVNNQIQMVRLLKKYLNPGLAVDIGYAFYSSWNGPFPGDFMAVRISDWLQFPHMRKYEEPLPSEILSAVKAAEPVLIGAGLI